MDTTLHTQVRARVNAGAAWLDTIRPDWRNEVETPMLDLQDAYWCVLGQVFRADANNDGDQNGYDWAFGNLRTRSGVHLTPYWLIAHGFEVDTEEYAALTGAWVDYLANTEGED